MLAGYLSQEVLVMYSKPLAPVKDNDDKRTAIIRTFEFIPRNGTIRRND